MNATTLTDTQAYDLLNSVCVAKRRQSVDFYDAVLWDVPASFDTDVLPKGFDVWCIGEEVKTIRRIICSFID